MTAVVPETRTPLPPVVLQQQKAIAAALELADQWDRRASDLHAIADYTRVHGTTLLADRYTMRGGALNSNAKELRQALTTGDDLPE